MKIVLLNTNDNGGGAAIACRRLRDALLKHANVEARILVQEKNTHDPAITSLATTRWQRAMVWFRFVLERLYFLPFERSKSIRFLYNPGVVGTDIRTHPLVQEADIIHLHWINFGFQSTDTLNKLLLLGKPIVWTFHDMWAFTGGCHHSGTCNNFQEVCGHCKFMKNPSEGDLSHRRWLAKKKVYQTTPFVSVTCSRWLGEKARKSSLLRNSRVESIPNPLDVQLFHPIDKTQARQQLSLPENKELILFAAMRVNAIGKGFRYLVEAIELLLLNNPDRAQTIELVVFGQVDQEVMQSLPITTHSLGQLSDPQQIACAYSAATAFVIPSLEENLPNTIMEAMACGTPVVGFRTGGIPEMIDHLQNGYIAEHASSASLLEGILWTLDQSLELGLPERARQKVLTTYSEEIVARQYTELYQSLL